MRFVIIGHRIRFFLTSELSETRDHPSRAKISNTTQAASAVQKRSQILAAKAAAKWLGRVQHQKTRQMA